MAPWRTTLSWQNNSRHSRNLLTVVQQAWSWSLTLCRSTQRKSGKEYGAGTLRRSYTALIRRSCAQASVLSNLHSWLDAMDCIRWRSGLKTIHQRATKVDLSMNLPFWTALCIAITIILCLKTVTKVQVVVTMLKSVGESTEKRISLQRLPKTLWVLRIRITMQRRHTFIMLTLSWWRQRSLHHHRSKVCCKFAISVVVL